MLKRRLLLPNKIFQNLLQTCLRTSSRSRSYQYLFPRKKSFRDYLSWSGLSSHKIFVSYVMSAMGKICHSHKPFFPVCPVFLFGAETGHIWNYTWSMHHSFGISNQKSTSQLKKEVTSKLPSPSPFSHNPDFLHVFRESRWVHLSYFFCLWVRCEWNT